MAQRRNITLETRLVNSLCLSCGADTLGSGLTRCEKCREAAKVRDKARREARKASAICIQCDEPAVEGRAKCSTHLARDLGYGAKSKRKRLGIGMRMNCGGPPLEALSQILT